MASFFHSVCLSELLHDELLRVVASIHEVDASSEFADVDAVDASVALDAHHALTHHVVDHDVSVLAEDDLKLVDSGVGIDAHVRVVVHFRNTNTGTREEFIQLEGQATIEVIVGALAGTFF